MTRRYRLGSGKVVTHDELHARLTAEWDAMDAETRATNCDGTVDDLIADSMLVGIYSKVDDEDDEYVDNAGDNRRARPGAHDDVDLNETISGIENVMDDVRDREPSLHRTHAKFRHLRELKRQREAETAARNAVADLWDD